MVDKNVECTLGLDELEILCEVLESQVQEWEAWGWRAEHCFGSEGELDGFLRWWSGWARQLKLGVFAYKACGARDHSDYRFLGSESR